MNQDMVKSISIGFGLLWIVALACAVQKPMAPSAAGARVRGFVVDELGKPVPGMRLQLNDAAASPNSLGLRRVPTAKADSTGRFSFEGCRIGHYLLSSELPEHYYGDTTFEFYRTRPPLMLDITYENQIIDGLRVVVGPAGGDVRGEIQDGTSGQFVSVAIRMWLVNEPKAWVDLGCRYEPFRQVVPSGVDFSVSIEAKGYKKWTYSDPGTGKNSIRVAPYGWKSLGAINLIRDP